MSRYIGSTATIQPTQASAGGVYTLKDQLVYNAREQWPVGRDPYFNYTTLLLQGDVPYTRGRSAMNLPLSYNADASTNNFLITPNGDVGPRPFSPYFGGNYSVYFDGTTDYLSVSSNAALQLTNSVAFTLEAWVYPVSTSNNPQILFAYNLSSPFQGYSLRINSSSTLFEMWDGTQWISFGSPQLNTWQHIAVSYEGSGATRRFFVNGIQLGAAVTVPSTINWSSGGVSISSSSESFTGYISNVRIVKGTAVYTSNFTPPTQPLQNITNTSLLTCQSNRFIDNSGNNFTITRNGDCRITDNSPFVSTDTTTGAGYFNGSSYLTTPASNIFDFAAGQAFTFECWFYCTTTGSQVITQGGANTFSLDVTPSPAGINYGKSGVANIISVAPSNFTANAWMHIVICRNTSNQSRMWLNGISVGSSSSDNYAFNNAVQYIGSTSNPGAYLNGYISGLRVLKGTAVYDPTSSSNITILTVPPTPITNTVLCTLLTRAPSQNISFLDSSPNEFLVTKNGNTTQGAFSPFSPTGWSFSCDATNTYDLPGSILAFGSGNWTIESWVLLPIAAGGPIVYPFNSGNTACTLGFSIGVSSTNIGYYAVSGATPISHNTTINVNQWYHIALVKDGSAARLYLNGVQVATGTDTTTYATPTGGARIAAIYNLTNTYGLIVNNLRIVTGQALYQANTNFIPSSQNLNSSFIGHKGLETTPITGTVRILTALDNRPIDRSSNNHTIARSNTPKIVPLSPFAPTSAISPQFTGGSGYFSGGSLTIPHSPALNLNSVDFCIEGWVYLVGTAATIAQKYVGGDVGNSEYYFAIDGTNQLSIALDGGGGEDYFRTSANTITPNAWNHCVVTRVGNAFRLFINGVLQNYSTSSRTLNATNTGFITAGGSGNYMSSIRIVKGTIPDQYQTVATTTGIQVFTPPTGPLTSIPGTQLLLNFGNAAAVDATGRNVLESVGNVHTTRAQAKFDQLIGGSSLYFDGDGDYLKIPYSPQLYFGSSNWTLEFWFYPLSFTDSNVIFDFGYGSPNTVRSIVFYTAQTSGLLRIAQSPNGSTNYDVSTGITVLLNQWQHIACVRNGSTITSYLNGAAFSPITAYDTFNSTTRSFFVGVQGDLQEVTTLHGYLNNLRITRGISRYATGTGANANQMVFNGTNVLALPTAPFPRG